MTRLSDKLIQEFKDLMEKKEGREVSWDEASEGAHRLAQLAELALDSYIEDQRRLKRLETEPGGFKLDGIGYTCSICGTGTPTDGNWYDKWGIKCLTCQKAIETKKIPGSVAKNHNSWYSAYDLQSRFNIKTPTRKKWIRDGLLKVRVIQNERGTTHCEIFLIKDNKDFLPPKHLTESKGVHEEKDGKTWFWSEPWYKFCDPFEKLKDYKIMQYMRSK